MQPMINMALKAAQRASQIIVRAMDRVDRLNVREKARNDFVSEVDRDAEGAIIDVLHHAYPDHGIIGEEHGESYVNNDETWIIDPLDGTTNFIHGIPHFAISIAFRARNRLEHAVIVDPVRNETFTASRGDGAQLNNRRIRVSPRTKLEDALLLTGIPFSDVEKNLDAYMAMLGDFTRHCRGIRRAGSAALDLAYVAAGRGDGFWEYGLKPWDIAAGALLVLEAGGLVSDLAGEEKYMDSGNTVAASPKIFKAMLQTIRPHLAR
jgi:myo-inositol-1(or 4)-monophosphatase